MGHKCGKDCRTFQGVCAKHFTDMSVRLEKAEAKLVIAVEAFGFIACGDPVADSRCSAPQEEGGSQCSNCFVRVKALAKMLEDS